MAPYVPLLYGAQVEIVQLLGGEKIENRLWFTFDNPPFTSTDMDSLCEGVAHWWTTWILPHLSVSLTTEKVEARDWTGSAPSLPVVWLVGVNGGRILQSHSANVAVVVPFRWPIGLRYKRNKNYVSGIPLDAVDLNTVTPVFSDALFEGYAALIDAARLFSPVLNWRWVVTSAWENTILRTEQLWHTSQGVAPNTIWKLGQRRMRLPQP